MKAILFISRYFKYLLTAKSKHSAQAPFLYDFITNVVNQTSDDENCKNIESLRKELCKSEDTIKITDFGAGSHVNNNKTRKIKDVTKNSAKNAKFGKLFKDYGKWEGESLLDSLFVKKVTSPRFKESPHYGYGFWLGKYNKMDFFAMRGHLGQHVFVFPKQNIII